MVKLIIASLLLTTSTVILALDGTPPSINSDAATAGDNINFNVWSRAGSLTVEELDASVLAFTSHQIREKFLANPSAFGDRFSLVDSSNFDELVVFTLLYEPFIRSAASPSCDKTWHHYLTVELAPSSKKFAISKLIIAESGEVLFGTDISPYQWSDTACPIKSNN